MNTISVSQLKIHPGKAITAASDYPLAVANRNQIKAYLLGKEIYEEIVAFVEDYADRMVIKKIDFKQGRDLKKVIKEFS